MKKLIIMILFVFTTLTSMSILVNSSIATMEITDTNGFGQSGENNNNNNQVEQSDITSKLNNQDPLCVAGLSDINICNNNNQQTSSNGLNLESDRNYVSAGNIVTLAD